jgi:drug/metabolite transporter (DMT)-like permease
MTTDREPSPLEHLERADLARRRWIVRSISGAFVVLTALSAAQNASLGVHLGVVSAIIGTLSFALAFHLAREPRDPGLAAAMVVSVQLFQHTTAALVLAQPSEVAPSSRSTR